MKRMRTATQIRKLRQSLDFTQKKAFAIRYGVAENYIWMLEHKLRIPNDTLKFPFDCIEKEAKKIRISE